MTIEKFFCSAVLFFLFAAVSLDAQDKCDPYMTSEGGYGYLIGNSGPAAVWWAEGVYKVMKDTPLPTRPGNVIKLSSARNEYESFIVVIRPNEDLRKVKVEISSPGEGFQTTVRKVEYVNVFYPTDSYAYAGDWPDPLPLYDTPSDLPAGVNHAFWITVKTPAGAAPGNHEAKLSLSANGGWKVEVPLALKVWKFTLPETPTVHSGFGFSLYEVERYENLSTPEQKKQAFESYMQAFKDYKMAYYNPFELTPIRKTLTGVDWEGGLFDSEHKVSGNYSFLVTDGSVASNIEAGPVRSLVPVTGGKPHKLTFKARTEEAMTSSVEVDCYDAARKLLPFRSHVLHFNATPEWKEFTLNMGTLDPKAAYVKIRLFGADCKSYGEPVGKTWYDDVVLTGEDPSVNLFPEGNFEPDLRKIGISLDFSDFEKAAKKYFSEGGFNSFSLHLEGLGSGTYYSRTKGSIAGFQQGTPEYDKLMEQYLKQMQDGLDRLGLLDKAYVYWFDEPGREDYPFVRETNALIKKHAPGIRTFITEHMPDEDLDLTDVTDVSCTIWHKVDHAKVARINSQKGKEVWTYLCTGPKSPWLTEFIDHDAINMRLWLWASYMYHLKGILIWQTNYWNSNEASPPGTLQNPWEEAQCFTCGYSMQRGQARWGNGDGRFFYPLNRQPGVDKETVYLGQPIPSVRLEIMRDGIEDYEYLHLLETKAAKRGSVNKKAASMLTLPKSIYEDDTHFSKDPQNLLLRREKIAEMIEKL